MPFSPFSFVFFSFCKVYSDEITPHALVQRWESEHVQARKFARAAASATVRGHGNVDQRNVDK